MRAVSREHVREVLVAFEQGAFRLYPAAGDPEQLVLPARPLEPPQSLRDTRE